MAVEHDVGAGGDLLVLEPALHGEGGVVSNRVAHHEPSRVAHEPAELDRRNRVRVIEVLAGPALLPARDGAPDGFLVEARRPGEEVELRAGLDRPGVHQGVVAVRDLDVRKIQPPAEALVVEPDPPPVDPEVAHRGADLVAALEPVGGPRPLHPLDARRGARDVGVDVLPPGRQVHRRHHGAAGADVLDPGRLVERGGEVVVGEHEDGMVGFAPSQDQGVGPRLVRLVGDAVEAREIEHVERAGDDEAVEIARLHAGEEPVQVAEALRQALPAECGAVLGPCRRRHRSLLRLSGTAAAGPPGPSRRRPPCYAAVRSAGASSRNAGITSAANRSSCSTITASGVPMLDCTFTTSSPGKFSSSCRR